MTQSGDLTESAPPGFTSDEVMQKASVENFAVASRLIPRRYREHLLAMYGFARFVDDIGDLSTGDRTAQLNWAQSEITRSFDGHGTHPIFIRAADSARMLTLDIAPFLDLIQANRQDQLTRRYRSYSDLEQYCSLSANPIGHMVLAIFGARDAKRAGLSDAACTALQIIEHIQDVGEDAASGRIYLPTEDLERFDVAESDLTVTTASPELRQLIAFESERAGRLLEESLDLVRLLHGWARFAVSGFIGGGLAQLDALALAKFDVLVRPIKATKTEMMKKTLRVYLGAFRVGRARRRPGHWGRQ